MHNTGLIHSGISWWGVYAVVLRTNIPCSCCKYLAYEHFCEHCQGMVSEGRSLCQTTVMALPWCSPAASSECQSSVVRNQCRNQFIVPNVLRTTSEQSTWVPLYVAFLGWKPGGKALRGVLPDSSALLCGRTILQRTRCLNRPVLQPVCVSFACCLPGLYPTLLTCPLFQGRWLCSRPKGEILSLFC